MKGMPYTMVIKPPDRNANPLVRFAAAQTANISHPAIMLRPTYIEITHRRSDLSAPGSK